ncbi:heat shock protein GrpE [compost metagenome]
MAVIGVLNSLLPVLDDVDAARQHGDLEDGPFAAIAAKLENALKTYGLERIADTGVEFDPTIHEALIQQPGEDIEVDTVSQVLRSGYRSGERVLRAAQVIVAVPA